MPNKTVSFYMEKELQKYMTPEAKNELLCAWYRYMFDYIPFRSGIMASLMDYPEDKEVRKNIKLSPEEAKQIGLSVIKATPENVIRFKAPYATRQYYGENFNFTHDLHTLAQARWAEVAADLHGEQIVKEFAGYVKRSEYE